MPPPRRRAVPPPPPPAAVTAPAARSGRDRRVALVVAAQRGRARPAATISTRTIHAGGNGARTSRRKRHHEQRQVQRLRHAGAQRRCPRARARWSCTAGPPCRAPGATSTRARATPSPPLVNLCTRPAGTTTVSPAPATIFRIPSRNVIVPSSTWKRSSCSGWTCAPGTRPSAESSSSNSSRSPPVSRGGLDERDALAAHGVLDRLSGESHVSAPRGSLGSATRLRDLGSRVVGPGDDLGVRSEADSRVIREGGGLIRNDDDVDSIKPIGIETS